MTKLQVSTGKLTCNQCGLVFEVNIDAAKKCLKEMKHYNTHSWRDKYGGTSGHENVSLWKGLKCPLCKNMIKIEYIKDLYE